MHYIEETAACLAFKQQQYALRRGDRNMHCTENAAACIVWCEASQQLKGLTATPSVQNCSSSIAEDGCS